MKKNLILSFLVFSLMLVTVMGGVSAATTLFEDDFESGTINPLKWTMVDSPTITYNSTYVYDGTYAVLFNGGTDPDDQLRTVNIDTTGLENIGVSYYRMTESLESGDYFRVEYSTNGGSSWTIIEEIDGDNSYAINTPNLPAFADDNPGVQIRFTINGAAPGPPPTYDYAALDNIEVTGEDEDPEVIVDTVGVIPPADEDSNLAEVYIDYDDNSQVVSCEIDWGDGNVEDCISYDEDYMNHQYEDGDQTYNVEVTVEDGIGNEASDSDTVDVENVDPTIDTQINAPDNYDDTGDSVKEAAIGEEVRFTASGDDVAADLDAGLTCTWTFDGSDDIETTADNSGNCEVFYTWTSASIHTVDLIVEDKDGGSVYATPYEIDIYEPTALYNQEVAAYYDLEADFGDDAGANPNYFVTGITSVIDCEKVASSPTNLNTYNNGDECVIEWDSSQPTNDEQGEHLIVVKVYNGIEVEYYSFTVTVYSWMIPMEDGWNFFSIPLVPINSDVEEVIFNDDYDLYDYIPGGTEYVLYSYQFDGTSSNWLESRRTGTGDLDEIVPGYGYWLKIENPNNDEIYLKGFGTQLSQQSPMPPEVEIPVGHWSMIGKYGILGYGFGDTEGLGYDSWLHDEGDALNSFYTNTLTPLTYRVFDSGGYWHMSMVSDMSNNNAYWTFLTDPTGTGAETGIYAPVDSYYSSN